MKYLILIISYVFFSFSLIAGEINTTFFNNLAIDGYDSVAYFTEGKPTKGKTEFTFKWKDANWRFSSQENLDKFKSNPNKYSPEYGGYCAFAMSTGDKYGIDPNSWKIVNGKLYLNYNKEIHTKWSNNQIDFIQKADKEWLNLKK